MTRIALLLTLAAVSTSIPRVAQAQEPAAASEEAAEASTVEPLWKGETALSYLATSGNSETETLGLDISAIRRPTPWGVEFAAQFNRAEQDQEKTAERYFAALRGTRALSKRWDAFFGLSAERDRFSSIDLRGIVEAGAVYKALLGPKHVLDLDFALTWTDEDRLDPEPDESWLGGLFGADYAWAISDNASFSQGVAYFANFDDSGDWRAESLTAVTASLNSRLALRFSYEVRYRNEPIGLNDDTDTTTKVALVWNL